MADMTTIHPAGIRRKSRPPLKMTMAAAVLVCGGVWSQTMQTVELPAELLPYFDAIRMVESRSHPWSIYDNTASRSYRLSNRAEAEATAKELISYGHNLDLGIMQLNCRYQCKRPGVSIDNIFDPQVNIATAKVIFMEFWQQARRISTEFETRIIAAVGAYNNGRVATPNTGYVTKVWKQLGKPVSAIPNDGTGTPATAVATAADGPAQKKTRSVMDDAMGRANQGMDWAKERLAAITNPQKNSTASQQPAHESSVGTLGMFAGILGLLGITGGAIWAFTWIAGIVGTKLALKLAYMAFKSRNKEN